jgi:hypothetical protein
MLSTFFEQNKSADEHFAVTGVSGRYRWTVL